MPKLTDKEYDELKEDLSRDILEDIPQFTFWGALKVKKFSWLDIFLFLTIFFIFRIFIIWGRYG